MYICIINQSGSRYDSRNLSAIRYWPEAPRLVPQSGFLREFARWNSIGRISLHRIQPHRCKLKNINNCYPRNINKAETK